MSISHGSPHRFGRKRLADALVPEPGRIAIDSRKRHDFGRPQGFAPDGLRWRENGRLVRRSRPLHSAHRSRRFRVKSAALAISKSCQSGTRASESRCNSRSQAQPSGAVRRCSESRREWPRATRPSAPSRPSRRDCPLAYPPKRPLHLPQIRQCRSESGGRESGRRE